MVLHGNERKIVYNVYCLLQKEADSGKVSDLKQYYKRTAKATGTSESSVRRIVKAVTESKPTSLKTPGRKKRSCKPVTGVNHFDNGVIKRVIHNFHLNYKESPTIEKLRRKLQKKIGYCGSAKSLRSIIKHMGFRWKRTKNNKKVLVEESDVRFKRIDYLEKIKIYRQESRPIIFTSMLCIDIFQGEISWLENSYKGLPKPTSKCQRIIIVHAGSEIAFVPNALLIFKVDFTSENQQENMQKAYKNYEQWLTTQLLPNVAPKSVIVFENTAYNNKQYDPAPTSDARRTIMQAWLKEKGIQYGEHMLKPQLYNLIESHKDKYKQFVIDKLLVKENHSVVRLPCDHLELSPLQILWFIIKEYIVSKNINWSKNDFENVNRLTELVKEKIESIKQREWIELYSKVKKLEDEYIRIDQEVDMITESIVEADDNGSEFYTKNERSSDNSISGGSNVLDDFDDEAKPCSDNNYQDNDSDVDIKPFTSIFTEQSSSFDESTEVEECKNLWRGLRDGCMRSIGMGAVQKSKEAIIEKLQSLGQHTVDHQQEIQDVTKVESNDPLAHNKMEMEAEQEVITDNQEYDEEIQDVTEVDSDDPLVHNKIKMEAEQEVVTDNQEYDEEIQDVTEVDSDDPLVHNKIKMEAEEEVITDNQEYDEIAIVDGNSQANGKGQFYQIVPQVKTAYVEPKIPTVEILPKPIALNGNEERVNEEPKLEEARSSNQNVINQLVEKILKDNTNEIDVFFRSMAASVKKLHPNLIPKVKMEVCNVIAKYEMQSIANYPQNKSP